MGKRSNMERKALDFYPTPNAALLPLLDYLDPFKVYHEPCAGDGSLINHLEHHNLSVTGRGDINPKRGDIKCEDAIELKYCFGDVFITNPPYQWSLLSPIMLNLYNISPTWLLLPADMMHNKRMGEHIEKCKIIVSVGRVKWIPDSPQGGMENSAWYLFDARHNGSTDFYGRGQA